MTTLSKDEVVKMAREAGYRADAKMHDHDYDLFLNFYTLCRAPLVEEVERLKADLEQTRVQLACCGVAAMQNTEESKANRVERGAYGWSASYGDVCRMVDSEIELRAENVRLKDDYQNACKIVAEMRAAAVGQIVGPNRGVVEDVADLRTERDDWKARALKAEQAEPEWNDENVITYCIACGISSAKAFTIGATHPQATHPAPRTAGDIPEHVALVCEAYDFAQFSNVEQLNQLPVSVFNALHKVLEDLYRRTYTPPQPAAQELDCATTGVCVRSGLYASPPGAVPVVEKLVEALSLPCDRWNRRQFEITRAAIAAGQKFIKENGK